ncbi:hypothetical protein F6X40_17490 [Paraburkholderia sp. UCT31]|uniref:hypothetical protein n=1 Tax=Paraburkholderia sp. UCT31 TaxID=2615209 RepID=UPI001655E6B5|nr:hypothetical protein [Paraburkholderia sp. UCT31]MBC8738555.1 hypothetical protein [Paraburkholderia sp. UCT31]
MKPQYDIRTLTALCAAAKLAIKAEREQFKKALLAASAWSNRPKHRCVERTASEKQLPCAPSHHLLAALVPLTRSLDKYLAQIRNKQSTHAFADAPARFVGGTLVYFVSGDIEVPEGHPLWAIPLPADVAWQSALAAGLSDPKKPYGPTLSKEVVLELSGATLGELRASYVEAVRKLEDAAAALRKKRLRQFEALNQKLRTLLSDKEYALLCEHGHHLIQYTPRAAR